MCYSLVEAHFLCASLFQAVPGFFAEGREFQSVSKTAHINKLAKDFHYGIAHLTHDYLDPLIV